jgi:hypothetical protein
MSAPIAVDAQGQEKFPVRVARTSGIGTGLTYSECPLIQEHQTLREVVEIHRLTR